MESRHRTECCKSGSWTGGGNHTSEFAQNESEMKGRKGGKGGGKGGEGKGGSSPNILVYDVDSDSSIIAGSNDTDHSFPNTPEASPRQAPGSAIKLTQGMYNAHRNWQHIKHTVRSTAAHHEQVAQLSMSQRTATPS